MKSLDKLNKQQREIVQILEDRGYKGMNSYAWREAYIQLPVRIGELKHEFGFIIKSKRNKDRSVDYILLGYPNSKPLESTTEPQKQDNPWDKPLVRVEKNGRVYWEEPKEGEQLSI